MTNEELELRRTVPINFGANYMSDGFPLKDIRTIPFRSFLRLEQLPPLPNFFSVDQDVGGIVDNEMFGNDEYGDCVKAEFAHGLLRFEKFEAGAQPQILTSEVVAEYLRETGGHDTGLNELTALKDWRNHGLNFGGKLYKIHAFSSVDVQDLTQVRYCIYLIRGIFFTMQVYQTDVDQFRNGEVWRLTGNNGMYRGGHGLYGYLYNVGSAPQQINLSDNYRRINLVSPSSVTSMNIPAPTLTYADDIFELMTWGFRQQMTTEFWKSRVMEAYGVIDQVDPWIGGNSPLDMEKVEAELQQITGHPSNGNTPGCAPFSKIITGFVRKK
jgi:hypothetical protein